MGARFRKTFLPTAAAWQAGNPNYNPWPHLGARPAALASAAYDARPGSRNDRPRPQASFAALES